MLEYGITLPRGEAVIKRLTTVMAEHPLPPLLVSLLLRLSAHYHYLSKQIDELEQSLNASLKQDESAQRLLSIPGVGPITARLLSHELHDGKAYSSGREFAASLG